jgi:hypothetical protein
MRAYEDITGPCLEGKRPRDIQQLFDGAGREAVQMAEPAALGKRLIQEAPCRYKLAGPVTDGDRYLLPGRPSTVAPMMLADFVRQGQVNDEMWLVAPGEVREQGG